MDYKKFTIDTTKEAIDFISAELAEVGVEGIEIEDEKEAKVSFYLDDAMPDDKLSMMLIDVEKALKEVATYVDAGSLEITASSVKGEEFLNNWKKYFHAFKVGDVFIKPTWEEADSEDSNIVVSIDPGTSFGAGNHETTKLCVNGIRKYLKKGDKVLDVGCGSGILSIVALKSGAAHVVGTDLADDAILASRDNARVNEIADEDFKIIQGNIIDDKKVQEDVGCGFDLAVANILAPVLIALEPQIINHIKDGGTLIISGIIDSKEAEVKEAFASNPMWEYIETDTQGEWVSIVYRKRVT